MLDEEIKKLNLNKEIFINIKVNPNSSKTTTKEKLINGTIKIDLKATPEKGMANKELVKYLAKIFKTSTENIKIITGTKSKSKLVKIKK